MKYDITKPTAPKMPTLGKGTECIKLLLTQALKTCFTPGSDAFPPLLVHMSAAQNFCTQTILGRSYVV